MGTGNFIKKENKFAKTYTAEVYSNQDEKYRGRLQVIIPTILGQTPFWVNSTLQNGSVSLLMIPEKGDKVQVKFKNKDIYSGEWELRGTTATQTEETKVDPNKYGMKDKYGNCVIIDKSTNSIAVTAASDSGTIRLKANLIILDGAVQATKTIVASDEITSGSIGLQAHHHQYDTPAHSAGPGDTSPSK